MKKFLLITMSIISSSYFLINSMDDSQFDKENKMVFSELGKNLNRTRTQEDYDNALHAYIFFGRRHNYPFLAPTFADVMRKAKQTSTVPSYAQISRDKQPGTETGIPSAQTQKFQYPATQPYKPSFISRLKTSINPYLTSKTS